MAIRISHAYSLASCAPISMRLIICASKTKIKTFPIDPCELAQCPSLHLAIPTRARNWLWAATKFKFIFGETHKHSSASVARTNALVGARGFAVVAILFATKTVARLAMPFDQVRRN